MQINPSGDVIKALGALPAQQAAAKPRVAAPEQMDHARLKRAEAPVKAEETRPSRFYRPGTILDIVV